MEIYALLTQEKNELETKNIWIDRQTERQADIHTYIDDKLMVHRVQTVEPYMGGQCCSQNPWVIK